MSQILVVSNDRGGLADMLSVLNAAGYSASGASTFEEAKRFLADRSPDLVIADERLGAFNGLHIIMRARAEHPHVSAIVTTPVRNRGLEADARDLDIECMVKPQNPAEWLAPLSRRLKVDCVGGSSTIHRTAIHAVD
jgi:DNA-binding response OmpR family regulator